MLPDEHSEKLGAEKSYGEIVMSSTVIGGANAFNYVLGLVRVKLTAVLLGPAGVGIVGLYESVIGLIGTASGMGIGSSGVREVAKSFSEEDPENAAKTVKVLRRACWLTGLAGWAIAAALSNNISVWVFGNQDHAVAIALLGGALLLNAIGGGQLALLQGVRRIGDLARVNVTGMFLSTIAAVGLYAWLGLAGIVPALLATAGISLAVSWWFARRIPVKPVEVNLREMRSVLRKLLSLGFAFMWSGLLIMGVDLFTRSLITREYGLDAAGLYQAAWVLSGMFAGFILTAMGADFYPRLTAVIGNRSDAIRLVNEQIEIGILLALPGLLATIALAPLVIRVVYTADFLSAAALLPWFMIGVFGRVASWPLGFIQLAVGDPKWFIATQTLFSALRLLLIVSLVPHFGLIGVAYAFAIAYCAYVPVIAWVGVLLIGFRWSPDVKKMLVYAAVIVAIGVTINLFLEGWSESIVGTAVAVIAGIACLRGLATRLGKEHKLVRAILTVPGASRLLGMGPA